MATTRVLNTPELLSLIGHACCLPWQYYNRDEVHGDSDLHEVLALHMVSRDFSHHFSRPFPRTALSICTAHQLHTLFLDVIAFEEHGCQCALSGGDPQRVHINFLNLYLLEVDLHNETNNGPLLWDIAQCATPYMTNWTELNIVTSNNSSTTMLSRAGHWWRPSLCRIQTLRLKDECNYGVGQVSLTSNLGAFLQTYNFTHHDLALHTQLLTILPHLRHFYLQYLHWQPLGITWEDPQGGTGYGRMFHIL
ncbi:uncharacterized protein TRAVEDRAFT_50590 [Trametes versicolor FP-101664 SS1]|uniref:uncharacterized protein n=1 Tax=Trametes versicolor (strain FP-101664) TaxID=717944 RepID=UPI00046235BF|nr:uncharacterized protein TRAVEDRAFT_50590 [Trametes versicolor FP-101664 SS1]EIW56104.1 hypothetical protein TRAVEDRAFT_50590 [Trametes versicolor FP-101664 SS1]